MICQRISIFIVTDGQFTKNRIWLIKCTYSYQSPYLITNLLSQNCDILTFDRFIQCSIGSFKIHCISDLTKFPYVPHYALDCPITLINHQPMDSLLHDIDSGQLRLKWLFIRESPDKSTSWTKKIGLPRLNIWLNLICFWITSTLEQKIQKIRLEHSQCHRICKSLNLSTNIAVSTLSEWSFRKEADELGFVNNGENRSGVSSWSRLQTSSITDLADRDQRTKCNDRNSKDNTPITWVVRDQTNLTMRCWSGQCPDTSIATIIHMG